MPAPTELRLLHSDGTVAPVVEPDTVVQLGRDDTTAQLDRLYAVPAPAAPAPEAPGGGDGDRAGRWVRMNMLGTLNARVTGPDGTSDSISNRADRAILKRVRAMSDAIIVGAQTVRAERHTATGATHLVIVSGSGDLEGHRISPDDAARSVSVLCPPAAADRVAETMPGAEICHPGGDDITVPVMLDWCRDRSFDRLVVEGGASLIGQFLDAGAIDEVCLTQAPVFGPTDAPGLPGSTADQRFRRAFVAADDLGYLYSRLVREH